MTVRTIRLPDVGEGIAEAELVAWHVGVGDVVTSDTVVAEVLTDKATVEIYAPVAGTVSFIRGEPGDVLAVGSDFVGIDTAEPSTAEPSTTEPSTTEPSTTEPSATEPSAESPPSVPTSPNAVARGAQPTAAPAVRDRARTLAIDLDRIDPSDPSGRITHEDLDRYLIGATRIPSSSERATARAATTEIPVIGMRRKVAERMTAALRIPHITYVDEIDMTALEHLRASLATEHPDRARPTVIPFVVRAIVLGVADQPHLNATFDDEARPEVLTTYGAVHVGIATQTPTGLIVPVIRDAESLDLWETAAELTRVTAAARDGSAKREELTGSTITITSLGALGGLVTTPIINHPEVAIVGINKMQTRPVWDGTSFQPRRMMNLSSSFDHRVVDGWDAATFIQRIKTLLEEPALLFVSRGTTR